MADKSAQDRLQSLFEKVSDDYASGIVEMTVICPEFVELEFLSESGVLTSHVRLSFVHATINNTDLGEDLVRVVDMQDPSRHDCYVSNLTSAIIAVVCR